MGILMIFGLVSLFFGVVVMILGKLLPGLALFFLGFCLMVAHSAKMFRGGGYRAEGAFFNGIGGRGRQQSEVSKDQSIPQGYEDRPSNIWDQVENQK